MKQSGLGRELGPAAMDTLLRAAHHLLRRGRAPNVGRHRDLTACPVGSVEVGGGPGGVELVEEEGAALGLVVLADAGGGPLEAVEGPEEAPVRLVLPADVAGAPPAVLARSVSRPRW